MPASNRTVKSEERLIPMIRAALAERMVQEGFHVKEIAATLNVTQSAVTQYLKKKRGSNPDTEGLGHLMDPLAEKAIKRARAGVGPLATFELLETARQF